MSRDPELLSLGLLGCLVRGAWLVLVLPIVALPSPVGLSVIIGPDIVDASGVPARIQRLIVVALVALALVLAAALVIAAAVEIAAYRRRVGSIPGSGRGLAARLVALQLIVLLPFAAALGPTVARIVEVATQQLIVPGNLSVPFVARVAGGAAGDLAVLAALLLVADAGNALVSRELLAGSSLPGAFLAAGRRLRRRPGRALGTALSGWLATGLAVGGGAVTLAVAWAGVVRVYLSVPIGPAAALGQALSVALTAVAFSALFVGVLLLVAVAGAFRSWSWTSYALT